MGWNTGNWNAGNWHEGYWLQGVPADPDVGWSGFLWLYIRGSVSVPPATFGSSSPFRKRAELTDGCRERATNTEMLRFRAIIDESFRLRPDDNGLSPPE